MARKVTTAKTATVKQTFAFNAPGASTVLLVGDFTHWQKNPVSMSKQPDGIWRATLSLPPGEHRYRFVVDGEWRDDPECQLKIANPYGGHDSVVRISPA